MIAVIVAIVVLSRHDSHRHMKLAASAGGLPLVRSGKPLQAEVAESLASAFQAGKLHDIEVGIYSAQAGVATDGVVVAGADAGGFRDAHSRIQQYVGAQDGLAASNGYDVGTVPSAQDYPGGTRGGHESCAQMYLATSGIPVSACAWVDRDTNGLAVSNNLKPAALAATLANMRVDMER